MTQFYTYTYFDPITDVPFYVGKGQEDRYKAHMRFEGPNKHLHNKIKKILREDHQEPLIEIYNMVSEQDALDYEVFLIQFYGRKDLKLGPLLNLTDGGEGLTGWTDERRKAQSDRMRGQKYMLGHHHTEKVKQAQRELMIGNQYGSGNKGHIPWGKGLKGDPRFDWSEERKQHHSALMSEHNPSQTQAWKDTCRDTWINKTPEEMAAFSQKLSNLLRGKPKKDTTKMGQYVRMFWTCSTCGAKGQSESTQFRHQFECSK